MPGRLRTASRPSSTCRLRASYDVGAAGGSSGAGRVTEVRSAGSGVSSLPAGTDRTAVRHAGPVRDLALLPKAHLHLHLTGGMRPTTLLELAAEQGRALPVGLLGRAGRASTSPCGTAGPASSACTTPPARCSSAPTRCGGWSASSSRTRRRRARAGWSCRSTRRPTRPGWAGCRPRSSSSSTPWPRRARPPGSAPRSSSPPTAPATRATPRPWPGWPGASPGAGSSASGCPTTRPAGSWRTSARRSGWPATPGWSRCRTPASCAARARSGRRSRCSAPGGSGTACGRSRTRAARPARRAAGGLRGLPGVQRRARRGAVAGRGAGAAAARGRRPRGPRRGRPAAVPLRPAAQYAAARTELGLSDEALADLAACSVRGSTAPADVQQRLLDGIAAWLAAPVPSG